MSKWYKSIAIFLSAFMFFMHPLALIASEVGASTINTAAVAQIPSDFQFTQDMYNGLDSEQVRMLQKFLNSDKQTLVKATGPGSPGNETTYFGNATQNAVERFQVIYKSVILDPIGFTSPTGIVGARSRSVLNQILSNLRNNLSANTNIFIGRSVQNTATSTAATVNNNLLFQSVNTGTSSLNVATTTATSTASSTPLQIETNSIPVAMVGSAYSAEIQATGGNSSYSWSILYGSLPNGVTGRGVTCIASPCQGPLILSGTPTSAGSFTFIVRLTSGNQYVTKELVINIQDNSQIATTTKNSAETTGGLFTYNPPTSPSSNTSSNSNSSSGSNVGAAVAVVGAAVAVGAIASAASSAAMPGFGGRLVYVQYCTCTAFLLLFIYDNDKKMVIQLMYIPGYSKLLSQYNIFASYGQQVLGGYTYGATGCYVYAGTSCVSIGAPIGIIDAIRGIGSSLQ